MSVEKQTKKPQTKKQTNKSRKTKTKTNTKKQTKKLDAQADQHRKAKKQSEPNTLMLSTLFCSRAEVVSPRSSKLLSFCLLN